MTNNLAWDKAQTEEQECWSSLKDKLNSSAYFHHKSNYWKKILNKASFDFSNQNGYPILEVGCGPSGIFMTLDSKARSSGYHLLDPLLGHYREIVPYLKDFEGFNTSLEESNISKQYYQNIFAINCIDHCKDMSKFCSKLEEILQLDGTVYLAVNTHVYKMISSIWKTFQPVLEPLHPYHFTQDEYEEILSNHFKIKNIIDIEDEIIEVNNYTKDKESSQKKFPHLIKKLIKKSLNLFNTSHLIFSILKVCGLPAHDFQGTGRSIYRHKLFVLKKKSK